MPAYLCHGFRWHRVHIRMFNARWMMPDVAPDWTIGFHSTIGLLEQMYKLFPFIPKPVLQAGDGSRPLDDNGDKDEREREEKDGKTTHPLHQDLDMTMVSTNVPDEEDGILGHTWSPIKFLEEYCAEEERFASRPYAFVADYAVRVDLGVDVAKQMESYEEMVRGKIRSGGWQKGWFEKLRDALEKEEEIKWYVVNCDDLERLVDEAEDKEDNEED